jgi:hypothetical protein
VGDDVVFSLLLDGHVSYFACQESVASLNLQYKTVLKGLSG